MLNTADILAIRDIVKEVQDDDFSKEVESLDKAIKLTLDKARNVQATANANRVKDEANAAKAGMPVKEKATVKLAKE